MIGVRLGPYEILSPLGSGGMGEVWRARDEKLDRDVALKVLPGRLASDPDALARFEREAKAVAALSHPNILAIHDFGQAEGTHYAVMELLEGQTLREALASGPLPAKKATEYGRQVAEGLAAAHDKGIVHRDLKPENLFVTRDGHVKILDFGLARQGVVVTKGGAGTNSPTVARGTEPGTVMGTAGYMAPEQVRGEVADHRADIFAFGAVLYEMLTGRRAFDRATNAETMTAILREEPAAATTIRETVPPALERVVEHCLEKRPEARFQSARDLAFDLGGSTSVSGRTAIIARAPKRPFWSVGPVAVGALVLGLIGGVALRRQFAVPPAPPNALEVRYLTYSGHDFSPAASPDGRCGCRRETRSRPTRRRRHAGARRRCGRRRVLPSSGGRGERRHRHGRNGGAGQASLRRALDPVGSLGRDERPDHGGHAGRHHRPDHQPRSPHRPYLAALRQRRLTGQHCPARRRRVRRGVPAVRQNVSEWATHAGGHRLTQGRAADRQPVYSPDGKWIVFSSDRAGNLDLWATSTSTGELRQLTDDAANDWDPAFGPDGRLLWSSSRSGPFEIWTAEADGSGARQVTHDGVDAENPSASRDGQWIVCGSTRPGESGIWRCRADGSDAKILVRGLGGIPEVSPDSRHVLYMGFDADLQRSGVHVVRLSDGEPVDFEIAVDKIRSTTANMGRAHWMPDGRSIAFLGQDDKGVNGVFVQDFAPGRDTSSTRRKIAGFDPEIEAETFGLSRDARRVALAGREMVSSLVLVEGLEGPGRVPR